MTSLHPVGELSELRPQSSGGKTTLMEISAGVRAVGAAAMVALTAFVLFSEPSAASVPDSTAAKPTKADVDSLIAEAGQALAEQQLDRAEQLFQQAADLEPQAPLAWLGLSEVRQHQGQAIEALTLARRAQSVAPDHVEAVRQVARLQIRVGAPSEALETLENLRRLSPDDVEAYVLAALVMRDIRRPEPAVELLRRALKRGLRAAPLFQQLTLLELALGRPDAAREVAREGQTLYPQDGPIALALGLALAASPESRPEAVPHLEKALDLQVSEPGRAHLELGTLLLELAETGCDPRGIEHLRSARELMPGSAETHFRLGNGLRACGDLEGAKAALGEFQRLNRRAETLDHGRRATGASLNQAQELAAEGRLGSALELLDQLLESSPNDDRIWTLKAKILFSMDRRLRALDAAREARKLLPGRVESHYLEGLFLSQMGRLEEARARLHSAVAIDAENGESQALLAAVLAELGQSDEAVRRFELALALKPTDPSLRLAYGRLLAALGREKESRRQMEVYRALGGN